MAAAKETDKLSEAYPMKSGDGPESYAKNSSYQRIVADAASELLVRIIAEKLDVEMFSSSKIFHIADLGCSVGPNTFYSVDNILEAVELKYQGQGLNSRIPEFQVFFNDHTENDFNMLFKSLPQNRRYYAAAVPGSFYGRILPKASLHFIHSSYTLHWLSRVPREVADKNSPAWNKGRILYSKSTEEVVRAYEAQYAEDMECFLRARAQEIVYGGLMVLIILGRLNGSPHSHSSVNVMYETLGSLLMDMAWKGVVSEEKVDSFNLPMYHMSPQELETAVKRNGSFSTEKMDLLPTIAEPDSVKTNISHRVASAIRAVTDGPIKQHFGGEILDELFDLFRKKLEVEPSMLAVGKAVNFIAVLKRKAT